MALESADRKAARYEKAQPGTGVPLEQAAERQERLDLKARRRDGGRSSRFVTVPALPWHQERD